MHEDGVEAASSCDKDLLGGEEGDIRKKKRNNSNKISSFSSLFSSVFSSLLPLKDKQDNNSPILHVQQQHYKPTKLSQRRGGRGGK